MKTASLEQYISLFRRERRVLEAGSCAALNAARGQALAGLVRNGLPTAKSERYKYCAVEAAFAPDYGLDLRRTAVGVNPYEAYRCNVPSLSTSVCYVVNDTPVIDAGRVSPHHDGTVVASLRTADAEMPGLLARYYNKAAARSYDGVTALNTLLAQDGILIYIPDGVCMDLPLQLVNISSAAVPLMANRRVVIVAGEGASATLLFCDHAWGGQPSLSTQVVEVYAGKNARLDMYAIEETDALNTRFNNIYVEQADGSAVGYNGVMLTCGVTRNQLDFLLAGAGASATANGAVIADGRQRVDNNILVEHAAPQCTSDLLYKYVLDGSSIGAYAGKVLVREGAQQTASEQTNANICASSEARAYSQPMLEIYADDVKCNHGSTVGKLDEAALFYMRQRGIMEAEARLLLQHAFINDVLQRVTLEGLRDRLSHLVDLRFRGQLSRCRDCSMCH